MVIKIAYVNGVIVEYSDFSNWDKLEKDKIKVIYYYPKNNNNLSSLPYLKECKQLTDLYC